MVASISIQIMYGGADLTLEVSIVFFRILSSDTRLNHFKVHFFIRAVQSGGNRKAILHQVPGVHHVEKEWRLPLQQKHLKWKTPW